MKLQRVRPTSWQLTLHPLELATLISAARWAADGAEGELPGEAADQLRRVLAAYDAAVAQDR